MNILVTGVAGFIGFNFASRIISNKKTKIIGVDNINNYYSVNLKKKRLLELKKNKKITFIKIDINNYISLEKIFKKYKFNRIYHFAAQAGVRYSIDNPKKYNDSNINGFFNLLELSKKYSVKEIIYSSSSSVYGENKKFPLNETQIINPISFYALSKKVNEEMAEIYSNYYNIKLIGLRFFTVYGEWGRPDMSIFKIIDSSFKKKIFYLNNFGNHDRDFTYIKDVIEIICRLKFDNKKKHEIFNICSSKPINLKRLLKKISLIIKLPKITLRKMQKADVLKTHGDNKKIIKRTGFKKFTSIDFGLLKTIEWYKSYYKIK